MCCWEETHINKLSYKSQDKDDNKCTHKLSHDCYFLYNVSCFLEWNKDWVCKSFGSEGFIYRSKKSLSNSIWFKSYDLFPFESYECM